MNLIFSKLSISEHGKFVKVGAYILCALAVITSLVMYVNHTEQALRDLRLENAKLNLKIAQVDKALTEEAIRAKSMENSLDRRFMDLVYYIDNGVGRGG